MNCQACGSEMTIGHRCRGWAPEGKTFMQPLRKHREDVEAAVASAEWGSPVAHSDGSRVMREAWAGEWHLLIEELTSRVDEKTNTFRGLAEHEGRGVKVRLSPQLVDQARKKTCPGVAGKSE